MTSLYGISLAKMPSIERRLARFVANDRIHVSPVWNTFLTHVLPFWRERRVFLVLDCTPFDDRATIVYVGLLVHSRVLPLAWQVMPAQEHWPEGQWVVVKRLLGQIAPHVVDADCPLMADRGLVGWPLVQLCQEYRWHSSLRECAVSIPAAGGWVVGRLGEHWDKSSPSPASSGAGGCNSGRKQPWRPT